MTKTPAQKMKRLEQLIARKQNHREQIKYWNETLLNNMDLAQSAQDIISANIADEVADDLLNDQRIASLVTFN